ncbi:hypothetical protein LWF01_14190 [Saxibacter everestensis]|uniref:ABC3 transporter permease C-terminal domain-containing protein n=1 Tax=Saxibacter everestensis TaxID=2909229 RepID=A0ABY8QS53_9MICO|nr:hypothetical protein LWF01_14190 [Brevibacteriaceae bacterium ZFBP1038]
MNALRIAVRLLKGGGKRDLQTVGLAIVAYAVATALLVVILGGLHGFIQRNDRAVDWSVQPVTTSESRAGGASGEQTEQTASGQHGRIAVHSEVADGHSMTVVDIAAPKDGGAASSNLVPPGMSRLPAPGEVWVSPALAELIETLPADRLADRLTTDARVADASLAGELPAASLPSDKELVAVIGRSTDDPAMNPQGSTSGWNLLEPQGYSAFGVHDADAQVSFELGSVGGDFRTVVGSMSPIYLSLAVLAVILMIIPLITLGSAAARLGVARRDARLAALRLIGATPGQVVGMTAIESMIHAAVGAVAGVGLALALLPLVGLVPFQGSGFSFGQLMLNPLWLVAVIAGVVLLAGVSAIVGLGRVIVSPLGVAQRQTPPRVKIIRLVIFVVVIIGWNVLAPSAMNFGISFILISLGVVFLIVNLIGPWVVSVMARIVAKRAKRAESLLAARRLIDDPKAAWRAVSGVALAGFVAAIVSVMPALTQLGYDSVAQTSVSIPGLAQELAQQDGEQDGAQEPELSSQQNDAAATAKAKVEDALQGAGVSGSVSVEAGEVQITQNLRDSAARAETLDRTTTALVGVLPGSPPNSYEPEAYASATMAQDVQTGVLFTLIMSFLVAAASAGIAQASSTLDRRQIYGLMHLAGTDERVLNRTRFRVTLWPLLLTCGISAGLGLFFTLPLLGSALVLAPQGLLLLLGCLAGGIALVVLASAGSRPILRQVLADTSPRPD